MSDPFDARAAKAEAMERVEHHANEEWKRIMYECVVAVARIKPRFNSDDVYDYFNALNPMAWTHEPRAFGPVMMRAAKAGVCRRAACAPVNSRRSTLHASPRTMWDSLIFGRV
jgi:hypothetical protein